MKLSPAVMEDNRIVDSVEFMEPPNNKRNEGRRGAAVHQTSEESETLFSR